MDYRDWIDSTRKFFAGLEGVEGVTGVWCDFDKPASEAAVRGAEAEMGVRLPKALRAYFLNGARSHELHYRWEAPPRHVEVARRMLGTTRVYGGMEAFLDLDRIAGGTEALRQLREYELKGPAHRRDPYLSDAMIAIGYLNGDTLALDLAKDADDPPVVYLAHDDTSYELGPNFDAFLVRWAELCYQQTWPGVPFSRFVDRENGGRPTVEAPALTEALHGFLRAD